MNMSTNFLTSLGRAKDSHHRKFGFLLDLRRMSIIPELRVILGWCGLVMVDAVQSHPKDIHDEPCMMTWVCHLHRVAFKHNMGNTNGLNVELGPKGVNDDIELDQRAMVKSCAVEPVVRQTTRLGHSSRAPSC